MALLLYPQFVIAFWAPLIIFGLWRLTTRWHQRLTPCTRFWLTWGSVTFPLWSFFVPYLPSLPLRELLPYRVPIAWGVFNSPDITQVPYWYALTVHLPFFLTFFGLMVVFIYGVLEEGAALWNVSRVKRTRVGNVRVLHVPGEVAFTLGVLRPRIYLSEAVWNSAHRDVVLAHERAHLRARHPLLLAAARLSARVWWYLPLTRTLLRELELTAELCADEAAVRAAGRAPLARAMQHALAQKRESVYLPATAFTSRDNRKKLLFARTQALLDKPRTLPLTAKLGLGGCYLLLFFLL
jgi:hypothetical protein